ncbi:hypothetical protein [Hydrogenophaga sp.]|uniref:hypothetical protein n=1 Tax=Hydrogenophaga sp. TaxID=1904254 RepID=UPI0035AF005B
MTLRFPRSLPPDRAALGLRWLVLVVIMFGTVFSSIGGTSSHGLAAIAASIHVAPLSSDGSHEHAHGHAHEDEQGGDDGLAIVNLSAAADHSHHGPDHSHDKAHALPVAWISSAPPLPDWVGRVRPWIEMVQASRLERPPMG